MKISWQPIIAGLVIIMLVAGVALVIDKEIKSDKVVDDTIGETVIIQGDTLMIIDYRDYRYVMNNGVSVNPKIIKELLDKEERNNF